MHERVGLAGNSCLNPSASAETPCPARMRSLIDSRAVMLGASGGDPASAPSRQAQIKSVHRMASPAEARDACHQPRKPGPWRGHRVPLAPITPKQ